MKSTALLQEARDYYSRIAAGVRPHGFRPDFLHVVSPCEMQQLQEFIVRGGLPADFEAKLNWLARAGLSQTVMEQNCRRFVDLLIAASEGSFHAVTPAQRQRLLQVLAYVRKDEDAIPDYRDDGYLDDLQEVRGAALELAGLLQAFKYWRLRQQVPRLWSTK